MQKKLIALAVAGLVSAPAFAQSNVQIYGVVDMGVTHRSDHAESGVGNKTSVDSGIGSGSRLGFKGTEDLGNGLKASFVLEMGMHVDQGQSRADGTFSRQSFLALSGNFGTVALGRQYAPQFNLLAALDPFGTGTVGQANNIYTIDVRLNNTVAYVSPDFGGFNIVAAYSNDAVGAAGATVSATSDEALENEGDARVVAIAPTYKNGPLMVGMNYHRIKFNTSGTDPVKVWDLGGSYDLGVVKLSAMYGTRKLDNVADLRQWMVGAVVPVGQSGKVQVSYNRATNKEVAGDPTGNQWAVGYVHSLSKRTNVYAAYADISNDDGAAFSVGDASNGGDGYQKGFTVGLRHSF